MTEHKDVQVARITARQTIIIATLSMFGALGVAWITGYLRSPGADVKEIRQHTLTIKPVATFSAGREESVRIVALVNSQAYSYPSRALWAEIGPTMSTESFPLPIGAEEYAVRFEVLLRDAYGNVEQLTSQEVQTVSIDAITSPVEMQYRTFVLRKDFVRSRSPELVLTYEIR